MMQYFRNSKTAQLKGTNLDVQLLLGSFVLFTLLAFYYGIRSSVYYTFEGVPVYWLHLSYHYLAAGWTWTLLIPLLIALRRQFSQGREFIILATLLAIPIAMFHRFIALFSDLSFRWFMGYTPIDPIDGIAKFKPQFVTGIFDSVLVYVFLIVAMHIYYMRWTNPEKKAYFSFGVKFLVNKLKRSFTSPQAEVSAVIERLVAKKNDRILFLKVDNIRLFQSQGNYIKIFCGNDTMMLRQTLARMLLKLDPKYFYRINRSTIVNVNHIKELTPWFNGEYSITLVDGTVVRTTRTFRANVDRMLGN